MNVAVEIVPLTAHLSNVRDLMFVFVCASVRESADLWAEARRAEILSCYPRTYWRYRVIHFYYLNTRLRRHKELLRRFARSYRCLRDLCMQLTYIPAMNIVSRVQAYEVATLLELAKEHGASEDTLHLLSSRMQYKPLF